jgi:hypothetical protein
MLLRSEVEQLIRHDLIKTLDNFKKMGSLSFKLNQKTKKQVSDIRLQGGLQYVNEEVSLC